MKVVINVCYGGFGISDAAANRCIELGMRFTEYSPDGWYIDPTAHFVKSADKFFGETYRAVDGDKNSFRSNPILVQVVEELGSAASGRLAKLKVVEIPFDSCEGWEIDEYDGYERIEEIHRSWN